MKEHNIELENIIERMLNDYEIVTDRKIKEVKHHAIEDELTGKRLHLVSIGIENE